MEKNEGLELKNKFKGTGKEMGEIAAILGMTRQNLNVHLKKPLLNENFKRLLKEKSKEIFHVEQIDIKGDAGTFVGRNIEDIISLKSDVRILITRVLELYASLKESSYAAAELDYLKDVEAETDRLYAELKKK